MPFPISKPLIPLRTQDLNYDVKFPLIAWRPDFFAQIALAEFCQTDWQTIPVAGPPTAHADIFSEIDYLQGPAMDKRADLAAEIIDQDVRLVAYFAQTLMLSPSAHPNAIRVLEIANQVGLLVAMFFKFRFRRGRPQQVWPGLVPLVPSPWHPSYPSGHSLQSHLIALALGEVAPKAKEALLALAKRIGTNREVAGVHFQSDTIAGRDIAYSIFPRLEGCSTFRRAVDDAIAERTAAEGPY